MKYPNRNSDKPFMSAKRTISILLPAIAIGLILTGCAAVGPDYTPIKPNAPERWGAEMAGGLTATQPDTDTLAHWWTIFNDRELSSLEEQSVNGNLELQIARSRIQEARALRGISQSRLFPAVGASAAASKKRRSESGGPGTEIEFYTAGFDAGWELDIFGGPRRSIEASQADLEASQVNLHSVLISLMAEVALNYLDVRIYQAQLTLTRGNIKTQEETYKLNQSRNQAGIIDELAVQESLRQEQALIQYQATILKAQEEVENALVAYAKEQRRRDSLDKAATAAQRAELLARDKYQAGLVDFNNVLDAQRSLLLLQNEMSLSAGAATANLVRLYKSLGGGWEYAASVDDTPDQNND